MALQVAAIIAFVLAGITATYGVMQWHKGETELSLMVTVPVIGLLIIGLASMAGAKAEEEKAGLVAQSIADMESMSTELENLKVQGYTFEEYSLEEDPLDDMDKVLESYEYVVDEKSKKVLLKRRANKS